MPLAPAVCALQLGLVRAGKPGEGEGRVTMLFSRKWKVLQNKVIS